MIAYVFFSALGAEVVGAYAGRAAVRRIPQDMFRRIVLAALCAAGIFFAAVR